MLSAGLVNLTANITGTEYFSLNPALKSDVFASYPIIQFLVLKVGDICTFGSYKQDNNTSNIKEDIQFKAFHFQLTK